VKNGRQEKRTGVFEKCKNAIKRRLEKKQFEDQPKPIMTGQNIDYEMGEKTRAMNYGGIGAIHKMVVSLNWIQAAIASGFKLDSYSASNIGLPVRI